MAPLKGSAKGITRKGSAMGSMNGNTKRCIKGSNSRMQRKGTTRGSIRSHDKAFHDVL